MSSDDDDFVYTPLQRSQVSIRESKSDLKSSKLSLSFRKSQSTDKKTKANTTPSKFSKIRTVKKGTPVKSRADHPDENCSDSKLAQWNFLFGSQSGKDQKSQLLKRKNDSGEEPSRDSFPSASQQKRKAASEKCEPPSTVKKKEDIIHCAHCKFPFNTIQESSLHNFLCQSKDLSHLPRCDAGSQCWETTEAHFWRFNHNEKSPDTELPCNNNAVKRNPVQDLVVKTDSNNSFTNDSGYNGIAGPSGFNGIAGPSGYNGIAGPSGFNGIGSCSGNNGIDGPSGLKIPSLAAVSHESPDIIVLSDDETTLCQNRNSMQLFDLKETENHIAPTDSDSEIIGNSLVSSNLLDSLLVPDIELFEEEQPSSRPSPSHMIEEDTQENQKSPLSRILDDSSGSETYDLQNNETEMHELEDPEGDELIASLAEEAIDQVAMPALEKVLKWRKDCKEARSLPADEKSKETSSLSKSHKTVVQPICIHLHYHEASPAPSTSKESGQTSILTYFKPTKSKEEVCPCGEKKTVSREENIAAWKGVMDRMQKRRLVSLPSISQSSSSEELSHALPSKIEPRSNATKKMWGRNGAAASKTCPFYKFIPDTGIVVDAFSYGSVEGVTAYFLSHFHYDHYCGLRKNFSHPIYCSEITARLVNKKVGVPLQYLNPLPMWKPQQVCGIEVTLLDANHCPGAVMFLFKVKPGVTHLHVGDFRAHPSMERYPALHCPINTLFLDTTYCSPEHVFPTQVKMIEKCVSLAQDHQNRNDKTLFVVGSYTIGKERVFKAIASSLNCSIWVKSYKRLILNCINDKDIQARLTPSRTNAKVHVLPMKDVNGQKLKDYLKELSTSFSEIVGMCPTGWSFTSGTALDGISFEQPYPDVYIYGIPYSEHSSYSELRQFVQFLKPGKIIPTVNNGNQANRKKMEQYFREWQTTRPLF